MEFMLLADGSVMPHETLLDVDQIQSAMAMYGGVAYYWHNIQFGWSCVTKGSNHEPDHNIDPDDVPSVIKLAVMLR